MSNQNEIAECGLRIADLTPVANAPPPLHRMERGPGGEVRIPQSQLLFPLSEFYAHSGQALPRVTRVAGEDVPEPYRQLLVHECDMTPTLEAFHGERIHLRVLERRLDGESLWRQVVLTLNGSARPVEFGAIVIHAHRFPPAARELILACRCPLGTILADHRVEHESRPRAFVCVQADPVIGAALGVHGDHDLYGRRNVLLTPGGEALAEILEILPPVDTSAAEAVTGEPAGGSRRWR